MNIAFFTECFRPTRNGVAVSVETFSQELIAMGHRPTVFAPRFPNYRDPPDIPVVRCPAVNWPYVPEYPLAIPYTPQAIRAFHSIHTDIIHAHSPWLLGRTASLLSKRYGKPLVLTYHTTVTEYIHYFPAPAVFVRPIAMFLLARYISGCDLVIVPSDTVAEAVRHSAKVAPRVVTLPTGINLEWIANGDRAIGRGRCGIPSDAQVLVYVGRVAQEKNIEFLIRSVAANLQKQLNLHLVIVGGGPDLSAVGSMIEEIGVSSRVHLTGSVPREDVRHYLAAGDVFVFASQTETQGIVVAEALAAGLPVVAIEAPGVTSAVCDGKEGFLSPPDMSLFADRVERLVSNVALRRRMARAARKRAVEFSARRSAEKLVHLYEELIAQWALKGRRLRCRTAC